MTTLPPNATYIEGARLSYDGEVLFDGVDMNLAEGGWTCLLGKSGVGKSSLLRLIAGLENDARADAMAIAGVAESGGNIAYMAQQDLLMPWLTLAENVAIGERLRGGPKGSGLERARDLLGRVGLAQETNFYPDACSGGMRQRAALARTLLEDRPVVLMDEPFSAVDAITRLELQDLAAEILSGRTVLLVTHDPLEALRLGNRIFVMSGRPAALTQLDPLPPGATPRRIDGDGMAAAQAAILNLIGGNNG